MALQAPPEQAAASAMKLYYRHRKNGAVVFRLEVSNRQRRIELNQISSIAKNGEIVPHKRRPPTDAEIEEMTVWWAQWNAKRDTDQLTETEAFLQELNVFTDWVQRRAPDEVVDAGSDPLLMAILDLRQVIVRRLSNIPDDIEVPEVNDEDPAEG